MANTHATSKRKVTVDDDGNRERPQKKSNRRMTAVLPECQVTPRMEDRDALYHNDNVVDVGTEDGTSKKLTESADAELGRVLQIMLISPSNE